ncbi:alkylmercury lyase family protein [Microbacterium aureliae]
MKTAESREVRDLVYDTFVAQGRPPSVAEIARLTNSDPSRVRRVLSELADAHALVLSEDGDVIQMAHPFTAAPMAFVLTPSDGRDDRRWWGGCAWDSFGISAALNLDVRIATACPLCGAHISFETGPTTPPPAGLVVRFPRPAAQWWDDVVATCRMIRMFCSTDHAEQWTRDHAPENGRIVDATVVWRLAGPWYGDRVDPDFQPHTREHNQKLLDSVGLTGPFWHLP